MASQLMSVDTDALGSILWKRALSKVGAENIAIWPIHDCRCIDLTYLNNDEPTTLN